VGQTSNARWRLSSSVTLHGGAVVLRFVRATPCFGSKGQSSQVTRMLPACVALLWVMASSTWGCILLRMCFR